MCWGREWKQQVPPPQHYAATLCLRAVTRISRTQTQVAVISALSPFVAPDQTAAPASGNTELRSDLRTRHYTHTELQVPSRFISLNSRLDYARKQQRRFYLSTLVFSLQWNMALFDSQQLPPKTDSTETEGSRGSWVRFNISCPPQDGSRQLLISDDPASFTWTGYKSV